MSQRKNYQNFLQPLPSYLEQSLYFLERLECSPLLFEVILFQRLTSILHRVAGTTKYILWA